MGNPWQHKIQYKKDYLALDSLFDPGSGFEVSYHFDIHENLDACSHEIHSCRGGTPRIMAGMHQWTGVSNKKEDVYWIDKDFPVFAVGEFLKKGRNTLQLKAPRMHILAEVMPVYILGDFLVVPGTEDLKLPVEI